MGTTKLGKGYNKRELKGLKNNLLKEILQIGDYSVSNDDIGNNIEQRNEKLLEALSKVNSELNGVTGPTRFGICEMCKNKIPKERLEIIPEANKCVECAEKNEEIDI